MIEVKTKLLRLLAVVTVFATVWTLGSGLALAAANTRYVAPGGSDTANTCTSKTNPCQTVQHAVDVASAGDMISLAEGTYVEQVTIDKSLTLKGKDDKSIIKAPATMTPDADGQTNIVEIGTLTNVGAGPTVNASNLTVAGPMPVCGGSGIAVVGGATLDIDHAAVRDIGPPVPIADCTNGEGISAGTQRNQRFLAAPDFQVGHIVVSHVTVTGYNRNGIVVAGIGSTGDLDHNAVATSPNLFTVPNGIVAIFGGVFSADHNKISGNQCTIAAECGPDFVNDTQSGGFLIYDGGVGISITHNDVTGNDVGIWVTGPDPDIGQTIANNKANENVWAGLVVNGKLGTDIDVSNNQMNDNGLYGIYLGSTTTSGTYSGAGSYSDNHAKGNDTFDLWWDGTGTPTFHNNHCGMAFPTKAAWDCK